MIGSDIFMASTSLMQRQARVSVSPAVSIILTERPPIAVSRLFIIINPVKVDQKRMVELK